MEIKQIDFDVDSTGINLVGSLFVPDLKQTEFPAIVFCHGLPAQKFDPQASQDPKDDSPTYPELAKNLAQQGFVSIIFNFRGTGFSGGNYHPLGWANDLEAILEWAWNRPEIDVDRIGVFGSSMGARVAIYVASKRPEVSALVSYAAPVSLGNWSPEERLQRAKEVGIIRDPDFPSSLEQWSQEMELLDPLESIRRVAPKPVLIVQGDADDIVDPADAALLYNAAKDPKEIAILPGVGHRFRSEPEAISKSFSWITNQLG
ncbi:MAG: alpha/beta hydrolase [Dehalococcoidia bacterium]